MRRLQKPTPVYTEEARRGIDGPGGRSAPRAGASGLGGGLGWLRYAFTGPGRRCLSPISMRTAHRTARSTVKARVRSLPTSGARVARHSPPAYPAPMLELRRRVVIGISGATGVAYGVRALQLARAAGVETHLVMTQAAALTATQESDLRAPEIARLADVSHKVTNVGASIASGSLSTEGRVN